MKSGEKAMGVSPQGDGDGVVPLIFINHLHKVLDTVARQGEIQLPVKPFHRLEHRLELHAHTVGAAHVGRLRVARVGELPGEHKLVAIVHIIEVHAESEQTMGVGVAQFIVKQPLGSGIFVRFGIHEIVGRRLLVSHTPRREGPVGVALEVYAGLGG